jgi:LDH2 family malate/lactate/ureidoglycolate dehydrogenase
MILFTAAGVPEDTAGRVVDSLVLSNLKGHDSHGIMAAIGYVKQVRQGDIDFSAYPVIVSESPASALIDGRLGFGKIAADFALDVLIRKTREIKVAAVGIRNCHHIGRLGQYAERAADSGIIIMITVCSGGTGTSTTPYGGAARTLGTNPYAFGCPAGQKPPLIVDFATTTVAGGKIAVARDRGESIPEGWILTKDGLPTTDPNEFYRGGMLQTMAAHKGFGLSMVAEALGGALTGATRFEKADNPGNCVFMAGIATDVFQAAEEYAALEDRSISKIKDTPAAPGFEEVLIPGEPERRSHLERDRGGIPLPEKTREHIQALADEIGVGAEVRALLL